jgi:hypothetical protein
MMRQCETPVFNRKIVSPGKGGTGLSRNTKSMIGPSISGVEMLLDLQHVVQRKLAMIRTGRNLAAASRRTGGSSCR